MIELLKTLRISDFKEPLLFGLLLYTEAHPHIIKILRDGDYCRGIDELSGDLFPVYAACLFKGKWHEGRLSNRTQARLIRVWREPNENKKILSLFNITDSRSLPKFAICYASETQFEYYLADIKSNTPEAAFESIRLTLDIVINAIPRTEIPQLNLRQAYKILRRKLTFSRISKNLRDLVNLLATLRGGAGV